MISDFGLVVIYFLRQSSHCFAIINQRITSEKVIGDCKTSTSICMTHRGMNNFALFPIHSITLRAQNPSATFCGANVAWEKVTTN